MPGHALSPGGGYIYGRFRAALPDKLRESPSNFRIGLIRVRPRFKINTHNPLSPPQTYEHIQLAPGYVREALEAYEQWDGKESMPFKLKELFMVLRIEVDRRYRRE